MPETQPGTYNPKNHDKGFKKGPKKFFPAWVFAHNYPGPNADGSEPRDTAKIVQSEDDIPPGWNKDPKLAFDPNAEPIDAAAKPTPPAPRAKGRQSKKDETPQISQRALDEQTLINAGYDAQEVSKATDAELAAELEKLPKKK